MHHDLEIVLNHVRGSFIAPDGLRRNLLGAMVTGLEIEPVTLNLRLRLCAAENLPSGGFYEPFREAARPIGKDVEGVVAGSFFLTHDDITSLVFLAKHASPTIGSRELITKIERLCGQVDL